MAKPNCLSFFMKPINMKPACTGWVPSQQIMPAVATFERFNQSELNMSLKISAFLKESKWQHFD